MDKLIVKGLGSLDGEYEFDLYELLGIGTATSLTNRELHRIKAMTGILAGNLLDALVAGDNDAVVGISAVILERNRKRFTDDRLWDAPADAALSFELVHREEEDEDPQTPAAEEATGQPSGSGGGSSSPSSASQENDPSRIGIPDSGTLRAVQG